MERLMILYALGPGLFGISLAYLLRHPEDWIGPVVVLLLSAALTVVTQGVGYLRYERGWPLSVCLGARLTRYGGLCIGGLTFLLGYLSVW